MRRLRDGGHKRWFDEWQRLPTYWRLNPQVEVLARHDRELLSLLLDMYEAKTTVSKRRTVMRLVRYFHKVGLPRWTAAAKLVAAVK
jgi:hypothetical protein